MLTCVYMGTNNSSAETRNAAHFLAKGDDKTAGIGGKYMERNVQDLLDFYAVVYAVENTSALPPERKISLQADLADYLNLRPGTLTFEDLRDKAKALRETYPEISGDLLSAADPRHALAYENIQARARQVLIMLIANAEGKMAIANPNLDEGRNAYATYGGDLHSGTINLNGFLPKAQELQIMQHLCDRGLEGVPPIKSLSLVLCNKPSAELQPKNAAGEVEQNDEAALQRSFSQMNRISQLMLQERTGDYSERRLNPGEVYDACRAEAIFSTADTAQLYNMVRFSYQRWSLSQHKIHAAPITPTFGDNVDHQTSLRTPNLSGQDTAELAQLGIRLLFAKARDEFGQHASTAWNPDAERLWYKRTLCDENFADDFGVELRVGGDPALEFDLDALYRRARDNGLVAVFEPPPPRQQGLLFSHTTLGVS
jgi:NH3-dependent NAD+ synthetase